MGFKEALLRHQFAVILLTGVVLGVSMGMIMRAVHPHRYSPRVMMYVGLPGELYSRMWEICIMPLITSTIVFTFGSVSPRLLKRLGLQFCIYVILTKLEAGIIAACFGLIFRPGEHYTPPKIPDEFNVDHAITLTDNFLDMVRNSFPKNMLEATFRHVKTKLTDTNNYTINNLEKWKVEKGGYKVEVPNMLGQVCMSVIAGITLNIIGEQSQYMISLSKCCMRLTTVIAMWIMWYAPIGIMSKMAKEIINMPEDIHIYITNMGVFLAVTVIVLTVQMVVYSLMYLVIVRKNPIKFFLNFSEAIVAALTTETSFAPLPLYIMTLRDVNRVDARIVDFVMPLGASLNKDGTAISLIIGTIFLNDMHNINTSIYDGFIIAVYCGAASLAVAPIPRSTFKIMQILLASRGLPINVRFLYGLDWALGRCRAIVNVYGDAIAVSIQEKLNQQFHAEIPDVNAPLHEEQMWDDAGQL